MGLFAVRQYSLPLMLAVLLHVAAGWALSSGWNPQREVSNFIKPKAVLATLIVLEAKAKPAVKPPPVQKAAPPQKLQEKPQAKPREKPKVDVDIALKEKQRQEREAAERERQEQARQRQERLNALAQSSLDRAIEEESDSLQAGSEDQVAQSYRLGMYELVRQNWSRPPSARNGMSAKLQVELIPTGEVAAVNIVESSGNAAFDRSAEQAVRKARRFEVPQENAIFERYFRSFYFLFQPEDLLR